MKKVVQNPIAEAVIKQCPNLSDQFDDYLNDTNSLSGDHILRILCEKQCEEQINLGRKLSALKCNISKKLSSKYNYTKRIYLNLSS